MTGHPLVAQLVFADFPPWPWTTLVLISAVFGWSFCVANQRGPHALTRYFVLMAGAGVLCLLAFVAYDTWIHTPVRFGFMRDFIVNRHWTPRGISLLWIGTVLLLSTPAAYYLMDVRGWAPRWLVDLGQTAMVLYFVHQVIVFTIVKRWMGVAFDSWLYYGIANAALMVLLLYLGRAWLMIRPRLRRRPSSDRELARSRSVNRKALDARGTAPLGCAAQYLGRVLFTGGEAMAWEAPEFIEVRMDAEINSYQDDFDREQDDRF